MMLIDATPLQSEHRLRGVGAYLRQLILAIEALGEVRPEYLVSTIGLEHVEGILPKDRLSKRYRPHQPAQVYWLYNELFLRRALYQLKPKVFFAADFNGLVVNPFGWTVAVLYDLTAIKLQAGARMNPSLLLSELRWRVYYHKKLRRADRIVAISHSAKRDAVELLGIPESTIQVIHLGIDHHHFTPSMGKGRYAKHGPYFVNIGGRNDNKNQARLLEAFARVAKNDPNVQLFFAGPWHDSDLAWLRASRDRLGLGERVRHLGYVSEDDLPSLYGNALAFVFPSLEEGFGLPVLEAMASGTPVITSNRSSLPEVAGEAALLVDPLSVAALAEAMRVVLDQADQRQAYREKGVRWAANFTWQKTAQETLKALGEAA